ncbi:hypothetical protein ACFW9O_31220 [Streptomyces sp. NPDC059499]|uniref:hypothetical protein n=1 Tax=Streptomyces sp. NPDC059499 TaxID=3346852 RepID=UPI0036A9BD05
MMRTPLVPGILGMGELALEGHDDRTGRRARDDRSLRCTRPADRPTSGSLTPPGPCPPSNRWGYER